MQFAKSKVLSHNDTIFLCHVFPERNAMEKNPVRMLLPGQGKQLGRRPHMVPPGALAGMTWLQHASSGAVLSLPRCMHPAPTRCQPHSPHP